MKNRVGILFGLLFVGALPLFAAVDAFIKFDGVPGEATQPGRQGWIEIQSASFGVTHAGSSIGSATGGAGSGKISYHDISITKRSDKASAALMNAVATGKHFQKVPLDFGGVHYEFEDAYINSIQHSTDAHGMQMETLKLSYAHELIHEPPPPATSPAASISNVAATRTTAQLPQPNATLNGGAVMLQSLKLNGQTQAIIVVCDVNGGQSVATLQRTFQGKVTTPTVTIRANPKQAGQPYLTFTFTSVLVSSYSVAPGGCSQMSLNFTRFAGPAQGY